MDDTVADLVESYNAEAPLDRASTPPAAWYTDPAIFALEGRTVFVNSWLVIGRGEQAREPGKYVISEIVGRPLAIVKGNDGRHRGFFNVCRHHAALVLTEHEGRAKNLCCPYHGWTYSLDGKLLSAPNCGEAGGMDLAAIGLVPVESGQWAGWLFVKIAAGPPVIADYFAEPLIARIDKLGLETMRWVERRSYTLNCNWKVFVDNYLDGGYHVPHIHRGLASALKQNRYEVETGERCCLQSCPIDEQAAEPQFRAVRKGARAYYYWIYPNFMVNFYEGVMDTNIVLPLAVDRTQVVFDYYFSEVSEEAQARNLASIAVSEEIQREDRAICESVQRGLISGAFETGRLSALREMGEHMFHRLLHADLRAGLNRGLQGGRGNRGTQNTVK